MTKRVRSKSRRLVMESPSPTTPQNINNSPNLTTTTPNNNKHSSPPLKTLDSLSQLAASRLDDIKRHVIDRSHSEILKDLEASHSRLHKRFKIEKQRCERVMEEADKDFNNMSQRINQHSQSIKESYVELMADVEANTSRVCKSIIPEVSKSFEKAIAALQTRYANSAT